MPTLTAEERVGGTLGGRYRLEAILGEGGTSTVYRALHTFTNRKVAVKLLKPQFARDPEVVSRFLQEARVASTVVHPHVVAVLDMGTDEDCTYLVMELLLGESLAARLGRVRRLPADEAVTLLRPLLEAVAVAHDKGIVHRDIKPENVLLGDRGDGVERAVLLDFGMAKTTEAAWGHMTQSGVLVGTPYYMSPEQAEGVSDLGPSTDVWSMGVLLYRALSGDLPFTGNSPTSLLLAIARGEHVPLGERAPEVPRPIAAWVESALMSDRQRRLPDMRAMLAGLDAALAGQSPRDVSTSGVVRVAPAPAPSPVSSRAPLVAGLVVVLCVVAGALYAGWGDAPAEVAEVPVAAVPVAEPVAEEPVAEVPSAPVEAVAEPVVPSESVPPVGRDDEAQAHGGERAERRPREAETRVTATTVPSTTLTTVPTTTVPSTTVPTRTGPSPERRSPPSTETPIDPPSTATTGLVTEW